MWFFIAPPSVICQRPGSESPVRALAHVTPRLRSSSSGLVRVDALTKVEAEELLDWLENHGHTQAEVLLDETKGFAVQWLCPGPAPQ